MLDVVRYETRFGTVRFTVPSDDEVIRTAEHARSLCGEEFEDELEEGEYPIGVDFETGPIVHRMWWLEVGTCNTLEECRCGRMSLVEVLDLTDDPVTRNEMIAAHMGELVAAYAHYWAGDAAARDGSRLLDAVCAGCLIHGEGHIEQVGGEANALAEELGEALAVYQFSLGIGERRIPFPTRE